jgi:O-antigen/teichoic acid export membrane protein
MIKNETLASTYPYAILLIMALNYRPLYFAISNVYFYNERTKDILLITFVAGIIALVCNIIFIPIYGIWAAVIINYLAFLYQGYIGFFLSTFKKYKINTYPHKRILLLQIFITIFCVVFQEIHKILI